MESQAERTPGNFLKRWITPFATHILLPSLSAIITTFLIGPLATQYWSTPRIKVLGVLPIRLIESQQGRVPLSQAWLGLILKVHNPSPSAGIIIPVATTEGCVKIINENGPSLEQAAEMSLPPEERVTFGGPPAAAHRHRYTVQRIFISGDFRDSPNTNIGISPYGTDYIAVYFRLEHDHDLGAVGTISLDGNCSEIKERNTRPTDIHLFGYGNKPFALRPEFSTGQMKISIHTGNGQVAVPPEVIQPAIGDVHWKQWTNLLLQQMYENPRRGNPPTSQPQSN